jgi:hypothetical protein
MNEPRDLPQFDYRGAGYKTNLTNDDAPELEKMLARVAPQVALVLEYLSSGRGLSVLIAHTVLGVTSLTTRIAELRKLGVPIEGKWHQDHAHKRFMVYHYVPGGQSHDEPLNLYSGGTEHFEDEGGPPHRSNLNPTPAEIAGIDKDE